MVTENGARERSDLALHVEATKLVDTHEHLFREEAWLGHSAPVIRGLTLEAGIDFLTTLFANYVLDDLIVAGAHETEVIPRLWCPTGGTIQSRVAPAMDAWHAARFTGYAEAVQLIAQRVYGIDELRPRDARRRRAEICGASAARRAAPPHTRRGESRPYPD